MKRSKFSILAVVALLTIGLTAFTKSDKKYDLVPVTNCYGTVGVQFTATCASSGITLNSSTSCTVAQSHLGSKVNSANNFFGIIDCDEVEEVFCCAQISVDPNPCPGQTKITFIDAGGVQRVNQHATITAIYCKSSE